MYQILLVIFLLEAIALIIIIMLQQNKNVDMRGSFSTGISSTLFSLSSSSNFMTRMTAVLATLFFVFSMVLGNMSSHRNPKSIKWDNLNQTKQIDREPVKVNNNIPQ